MAKKKEADTPKDDTAEKVDHVRHPEVAKGSTTTSVEAVEEAIDDPVLGKIHPASVAAGVTDIRH